MKKRVLVMLIIGICLVGCGNKPVFEEDKPKDIVYQYTEEDAVRFVDSLLNENSSSWIGVNMILLDAKELKERLQHSYWYYPYIDYQDLVVESCCSTKYITEQEKKQWDGLDSPYDECVGVYETKKVQKKIDDIWGENVVDLTDMIGKPTDFVLVSEKGYIFITCGYGSDDGVDLYEIIGATRKAGDVFVVEFRAINIDSYHDGYGFYDWANDSKLQTFKGKKEIEYWDMSFSEYLEIAGVKRESLGILKVEVYATDKGLRLKGRVK